MKYTHRTLFIKGVGKKGEKMAKDIENSINLMENDGWEYLHPVTLSGDTYSEVYLVFRRERI